MLQLIAKNPECMKAAKAAADLMEKDSLDIKEFTIPNTSIKLFLVKDGTQKAKELNEIKGSFLGMSYEFDEKVFLVFRTNKTA